MRRFVATAIALALTMTATPALAGDRKLPVPADKGWQHAETGLVLTASLAGLARTKLVDLSDNERDIVAEFADADADTVATVYIFHPGLMSVPIWFDRIRTLMELRAVYGGLSPVTADAIAFAAPGATVAGGLRQMFAPKSGAFRATGAATVPIGDWLVGIRLTSTTLDPAAADAKLNAVIAAVRWPKEAAAPVASVPVRACPDTLDVHKAKLVKPSMTQLIMGSVLRSIVAAGKADGPPATYCREPMKPTADFGVYRLGGARDSYIVAIGDSGRAATVGRQSTGIPGLQDDQPHGYSVTYRQLNPGIETFPSFDRLPQPQQVVDLVLKGEASAVADPTNQNIRVKLGQ